MFLSLLLLGKEDKTQIADSSSRAAVHTFAHAGPEYANNIMAEVLCNLSGKITLCPSVCLEA